MKLLHNVPAITKAVILAGLMSACQNEKDAIVSPSTPIEHATDANAKTVPGFLIKDGATKLTYSGVRNLLTKEIDNDGYTKEYSYEGNKITCALKKNAMLVYKNFITYTLDSKGRCVESVHTATDKVIGGTYIYVYNELNQLTLIYHKTLPKLRQVFEYEQDADNSLQGKSLSKVTIYDQYDNKDKEILFQYANGNNNGYVSESNHLNPEPIALTSSKYLPIFGKFSRYFLKQTIHKSFGAQVIYPYPTFNYSWGLKKTVNDNIFYYNFQTKNELGKVLSNKEIIYSVTPQTVLMAQ